MRKALATRRGALLLFLCSVLQRPYSSSSLPASAAFDPASWPACRCRAATGAVAVLLRPSRRLRGGGEGERRSKSAPSRGGKHGWKPQVHGPGNLTDSNSTNRPGVLGDNSTDSRSRHFAKEADQAAANSPITADDFRISTVDIKAPSDANGGVVVDIQCLQLPCGLLQQQRAREGARRALRYLCGWCTAPGAVGTYCRWRAANYWQALELEVAFILCPYLLVIWAVAAASQHGREACRMQDASDAPADNMSPVQAGAPISPALVLWAGMHKLLRVPVSIAPAADAPSPGSARWSFGSKGKKSQDTDPGMEKEEEEWLWEALVERRWSQVKWTRVAAATAACMVWLLAPRAILMPVHARLFFSLFSLFSTARVSVYSSLKSAPEMAVSILEVRQIQARSVCRC